MAIKVTCPSCGSTYKYGDEFAGKKVRCKNCEAAISIPADEEDEDDAEGAAVSSKPMRSKSSRGDDDDDDQDEQDDRPSKKRRRPKADKGSNKNLFIILGAVGGVLLLCCAGSVVGIVIAVNKASVAAKDFAKKFDEEMKKQQKVMAAQKGMPVMPVMEEKVIGKLVLNQTDKINPNDPNIAVDRGNGFTEKKRAKTFNVQFTQGKTYVITMKQAPGSPLDPFLVLADPTGKTIASDDDSGGFPTARIMHAAAMNGQYRVIATSFGNSAGDFTLTVEER